jgi:hypothetical protein
MTRRRVHVSFLADDARAKAFARDGKRPALGVFRRLVIGPSSLIMRSWRPFGEARTRP